MIGKRIKMKLKKKLNDGGLQTITSGVIIKVY